jgi:hypothetical protein
MQTPPIKSPAQRTFAGDAVVAALWIATVVAAYAIGRSSTADELPQQSAIVQTAAPEQLPVRSLLPSRRPDSRVR